MLLLRPPSLTHPIKTRERKVLRVSEVIAIGVIAMKVIVVGAIAGGYYRDKNKTEVVQ